MQKLVPSFWFNRNALDAAEFYAKTLPHTSVVSVERYPETGLLDFQQPFAGQPLTVDLEIDGFRLTFTNADDTFAPNPSISLMLNFDPASMENPRELLEATWNKLSDGGQILMPLGEYDFSNLYGWCADKYGVNWQLILGDADGDPRPFVMPAMLFTQGARGKAAAAKEKYLRVLSQLGSSQEGMRVDYPESPGIILFADAQLAGEWVVINDSTFDHAFTFTEGVSFVLYCKNQEVLDAVWAELAQEEQPCGWCKDEFGVSWQILPENLGELMASPGSFEKLMQMSKIQIDQF